MNWIIYLFGSGAVFFAGVGLVLLGVAALACCQRPRLRGLASLLPFVGLLLVAASATPLPYWLYAANGGATLLWLVAERFTAGRLFARRNWLRGLVVAAWIAALALEVPYHLPAKLNMSGSPAFYILGDSVTAGMGGEKTTWPRLLANTRPVEVVDLSRAGATASSALRQAEGLPPQGGLLLVEIGGNDVLGSTSAAKFAVDLDRLLGRVCVPGRTVGMFELPLPPFCNDFGLAQRRLASKHGVVLVPKRVLVTVLTSEGSTLDSIHLTRLGHERMAETVWDLIRPAYGE